MGLEVFSTTVSILQALVAAKMALAVVLIVVAVKF